MNQPNNNFFPWDDIQEDNVFPTGCFQVEIANLEDGFSQSSGNRMFKAQFTCRAPMEFAGMSHFENYVTGTEENPTGINAGTMGARGLKKMLKAAQVPQGNDIEQLCMSAKGAAFMLTLNCYTEPEDSNFAPGEKRNRVVAYDRLGAREPGLAPVKGAGQKVTPTAPNLPPSPAPAPVAPVQQPAPVQVPTAPPVQTAPPAPAPTVAAPPAQPAAPAANPADPMITCTICNAQVPASQLGAHVAAHAQQG